MYYIIYLYKMFILTFYMIFQLFFFKGVIEKVYISLLYTSYCVWTKASYFILVSVTILQKGIAWLYFPNALDDFSIIMKEEYTAEKLHEPLQRTSSIYKVLRVNLSLEYRCNI